MHNNILYLAIKLMISKLRDLDKVPEPEIEINLRLDIESVLCKCLEEENLDLVSNLRLDEINEDFWSDDKIDPMLIAQMNENLTFEEAWDELMQIIRNKK
jgi:hypothetical protein